MQEGKDSYVSRNGNRTREAFIYNPETSLWYLTKPMNNNEIAETYVFQEDSNLVF